MTTENNSTRTPLSGAGNSRRFVDQHGAGVRHIPNVGWYAFNGAVWTKCEDGGAVIEMAKATARAIYGEAAAETDSRRRDEIARHARDSESEWRLKEMVSLSKSVPGITARVEDFDANPDLIAVANGTVDLKSGELTGHRRGDLLTKISPVAYDKDATAPRFTQFLGEVFAGDGELISWMQKAIGYSITGHTREQVFFLLHGFGANGKSTLIEILNAITGDLAKSVSTEVLMAGNSDAERELAGLRGCRFLNAVESEMSGKLAEGLVKRITGSDRIVARYLYKESFEYTPTFKLWLGTNHLPAIKDNTFSIWRRIKLIPFGVKFDGASRDSNLRDKLLAELPGILNWIVEGARRWYAEGLSSCPAVECATNSYQAQSDHIAEFIADSTESVTNGRVPIGDLRSAYEIWCRQAEETPVNARELKRQLESKGFRQQRAKNGRFWFGLALKPDAEEGVINAVGGMTASAPPLN